MSTTTVNTESGVSAASRAYVYNALHTLDSLAEMPSSMLEELYRSAPVPENLAKLAGRPQGRMLAVACTEGTLVFSALKTLSAMSVFPWEGKSFQYEQGGKGSGVNRVRLLFGSFDWFPFATRIAPSAIDGKACVFLDYAQPENPALIARIHDEIREISPGLWLGPAMLRREAGSPVLVLWFAVDFNRSR